MYGRGHRMLMDSIQTTCDSKVFKFESRWIASTNWIWPARQWPKLEKIYWAINYKFGLDLFPGDRLFLLLLIQDLTVIKGVTCADRNHFVQWHVSKGYKLLTHPMVLNVFWSSGWKFIHSGFPSIQFIRTLEKTQ